MATTTNRMRLGVGEQDLLDERQLDELVRQAQSAALELGMIPIAGVMSKEVSPGRHRVLGVGWNQLRAGIPGIHGETGAVMDMGWRAEGYGDVVATSSLSPCPFCQCMLVRQMGIRKVRILNADPTYEPDNLVYHDPGVVCERARHAAVAQVFNEWVGKRENDLIWARDIGLWHEPSPAPFDVDRHADRAKAILKLARNQAERALAAGEAPIGAAVVDRFGEVIGCGHSAMRIGNDPSLTAAMAAWRACGAREHWKDKTLFLTTGPDWIAYSMFHIFGFGQLVIGSDRPFAGTIAEVSRRGVPVKVLGDERSQRMLGGWLKETPVAVARQYLGADFQG